LLPKLLEALLALLQTLYWSFTCFTADVLLPKLPAQRYIDRGKHENELKQVQ
jgi:hypothetical protein